MLRWVPISAGWWMLKEVGRQSAGSGPEVDGFNESTRRNPIQCEEGRTLSNIPQEQHTYYRHTCSFPGRTDPFTHKCAYTHARKHMHTRIHTHTLTIQHKDKTLKNQHRSETCDYGLTERAVYGTKLETNVFKLAILQLVCASICVTSICP